MPFDSLADSLRRPPPEEPETRRRWESVLAALDAPQALPQAIARLSEALEPGESEKRWRQLGDHLELRERAARSDPGGQAARGHAQAQAAFLANPGFMSLWAKALLSQPTNQRFGEQRIDGVCGLEAKAMAQDGSAAAIRLMARLALAAAREWRPRTLARLAEAGLGEALAPREKCALLDAWGKDAVSGEPGDTPTPLPLRETLRQLERLGCAAEADCASVLDLILVERAATSGLAAQAADCLLDRLGERACDSRAFGEWQERLALLAQRGVEPEWAKPFARMNAIAERAALARISGIGREADRGAQASGAGPDAEGATLRGRPARL